MDIYLNVEVVIYAEEKEQRHLLVEGSKNYGVFPKDLLLPLRKINGEKIPFSLSNKTTINDVINAVTDRLVGNGINRNLLFCIQWAFVGSERYYVENREASLLNIIRKYLNYPQTNEVLLQLLLSADGGAVGEEDGLRYYMYSHEKGEHHLPHVHVCTSDHNYSGVFLLKDGSLLRGDFPRRKEKTAKAFILKNQKELVDYWNTKTDGITVDINNHFNLIGY